MHGPVNLNVVIAISALTTLMPFDQIFILVRHETSTSHHGAIYHDPSTCLLLAVIVE